MPCTTILVGKKASNNGSSVIARTDDGHFTPKRIDVMLPKNQPRKYTSKIGHLTVELPDNPLRYTYAPNVPKEDGTWPDCGINSANVAMSATETITSNPRVLGADPLVKYEKREGKKPEKAGGIGEEDFITLVLPYVKTAREGVLRLGALLEQYGTYESNGISFADSDGIWWLETIGGHHWLARRVPDDRVVVVPNQFGLDNFDFDDAYGEGKENLCSSDLREFVEANCLYTGKGAEFNPRLAFGSRKDSDRIYNAPRAWFIERYFLGRTYKWDGDNADFTPESTCIPWSFVPERKVTIEDVRYLLGSYYQGTPYNPYDTTSPVHGRYRAIGVPNSDNVGILEIRANVPDCIKGVEWLSLGGSGFTACFPVYAAVDKLPKYISGTTETVSTDNIYWHSRMIAAFTDFDYKSAIIHDERYQDAVLNGGRKLLCEYDKMIADGANASVLAEANEKICAMVKKESDKALRNVLDNASEHMTTRYHRGDN